MFYESGNHCNNWSAEHVKREKTIKNIYIYILKRITGLSTAENQKLLIGFFVILSFKTKKERGYISLSLFECLYLVLFSFSLSSTSFW